MEVKIYVKNLSKATTQEELKELFTNAGTVTTVDMIKDRKSGASKGFALITMSAQSEADKAVSLFNRYSLNDQEMKVDLTKPRVQRGFSMLV
jgi:RNA recognition motif-containing protein